jgi:hypothetical protein
MLLAPCRLSNSTPIANGDIWVQSRKIANRRIELDLRGTERTIHSSGRVNRLPTIEIRKSAIGLATIDGNSCQVIVRYYACQAVDVA